jgi:ankyrin repeat protein
LTAEYGHESVTEKLVAARCKVDLQDKNGDTPLHETVIVGHQAVTKQLIEALCNIDVQDKDGSTPLFVAARAHRNRHTDTEHKATGC